MKSEGYIILYNHLTLLCLYYHTQNLIEVTIRSVTKLFHINSVIRIQNEI